MAAAWIPIAAMALDAISSKNQSDANVGAQRSTNRYNLMLQREQQQWESMMSGTAVQRRVADITAAGGNPALAFTAGQEATTPTVAPARFEAPHTDFRTNFTAAALANAQLQNVQAQTRYTNSQTTGQTIRNNIDNAFANEMAAIKRDKAMTDLQGAQKNYDLLEQQLKNAVAQEIEIKTRAGLSAAQTEQTRRMTPALVQAAVQQARSGELDLQALERIAQIGGVDAKVSAPIIKTIIDILRTFFK